MFIVKPNQINLHKPNPGESTGQQGQDQFSPHKQCWNIKHLKLYQLTRTEDLSQKRENTTRNNTQMHIIEYEITKLAFHNKLVQSDTQNPHSHLLTLLERYREA